jgi:outer membrane lipoprotein
MTDGAQKIICLCVGIVMLGACASQIPEGIRQGTSNSPSIAVVKTAPADYFDQTVRWGGAIIEIQNRSDHTRLTILSYPLNNDGRPRLDAPSQGRFIAVVTGFLEPSLYAPDREITINGVLRAGIVKKVGDYDYAYPVVNAEINYLWPIQIAGSANNYPYYWNDPWRYHYNPYWRHHY